MDIPEVKVFAGSLFFRALVLEERGDFDGVKVTEKLAAKTQVSAGVGALKVVFEVVLDEKTYSLTISARLELYSF